jgi:hypothetical protein
VLSNDSRDWFCDCEESMATVVDDAILKVFEGIVRVIIEPLESR